jgi:L-lysine 6-transaminase
MGLNFPWPRALNLIRDPDKGSSRLCNRFYSFKEARLISPQDVKRSLSRHMLTEGFDMILDMDRSKGSWFVDQRNGDRYLDFFSMYASMAVGYNHPVLLAARDELGRLAVNKPSNSDIYTQAMAEFLETFSRVGIPDYLPHAFFIEGGALAVENALKAAFDWKTRKNLKNSNRKVPGSKIIHFRQAFHGRSGYALSLTNTFDGRKTKYFPRFHWPLVINPKITFPIDTHNLGKVKALEKKALEKIRAIIDSDSPEIAAIIIEPIQGEGGDNHFRNEFLQALRRICDEYDILLIFDEVQSGVGLTGKFWAHQHFGIQPDILSFGKKTQVCGILASTRLDEVEKNVFREKSRISSTFGGGLIDMVRSTLILRIIEEERLVENARIQGEILLSGIRELAGDFPDLVSNPRGRGLMCAFDAPDSEARDRIVRALVREKLLIVGCGIKGIRFRPHLIISEDEVSYGLDIIRRVLKKRSF